MVILPGGGENGSNGACFGPGDPPLGQGQLTQEFVCGEPHESDYCLLTFRYQAAPGSKINVRFSNNLASSDFSDRDAIKDNQWHSGSLSRICGKVKISVIGYGNPQMSFDNFVATCVPEPSPIAALCGGGAVFLFLRRRIRKFQPE